VLTDMQMDGMDGMALFAPFMRATRRCR